MFAEISFPISSYQVFSYKIPDELRSKVAIGVRALVTMRNRKTQGIIVGIKKTTDFKGKIYEIDSLVDEAPILNRQLWRLVMWMGDYYSTPLGIVAKTVLPANLNTTYKPRYQLFVKAKNGDAPLSKRAKSQLAILDYLSKLSDFIPVTELRSIAKNPLDACKKLATKEWVELIQKPLAPDISIFSLNPIHKNIKFSDDQLNAIEKLMSSIDEKQFKPYLLHGVTGSGKTEIYIEAARHSIRQNKSVIMLLPEISLTPQIAGRFRAAFGDKVALWHSKLSQSARAWTWKRICLGDYKVVIGARSAIFAPLRNLGLIIVDEEQENAYKQDAPSPRYHAREVALMRGKIHNATVVLSSATPSMETYFNYINEKYGYIHLPQRFGGAKYPDVHVIDMIKEASETDMYGEIFSRTLIDKIEDRLSKNEQTIILHNRRGYAPVLRCEDCGFVHQCEHCQVALTFHKYGKFLQCHFCNYTQRQVPNECNKCLSVNIKLSGVGTQKIEDELALKFPNASICRLDGDTLRSGKNITKVLQEFSNRNIDILLGTQMIAKGLDFANATLVGIINGDTGLYLPDFRSGEKVFQLIYQASGRSGRGRTHGDVVVQTYNPNDPVIQCATKLDLKKYYNICLKERQALNYPPFSWMIKIEMQGRIKSSLENAMTQLKRSFKNLPKGIEILGPAYCYREKIRDYYRMQIVLKSNKSKDPNGVIVNNYYKSIIKDSGGLKMNKGLKLIVDVNPVSLL